MLNNDPPPGTRVRFLREVRTAKTNDVAILRGPLRKYDRDNPTDEFEVEFSGIRMTVQRQDIERVR